MTSEDDFQAALDANPEDWHTRLVFADWLQEHDDRRAEGYRALGVNRRRPYGLNAASPDQGWADWYNQAHPDNQLGNDPPSDLPEDWFQLLKGGTTAGENYRRMYRTRRAAENAAVRAFAKLPAARRTELLVTDAISPKPAPKKPARRPPKKSAKAKKPKRKQKKK